MLVFGIAFGYVEAAVVMYLRAALGTAAVPLFPLLPATGGVGSLVGIEVGREAATLVMLGALGWAVGRRGLERLAWTAVVFGTWDLAYYAWLWVFSGWPPSLGTWDVLFLVPLPWVAPVWAPALVSIALVTVGLMAARRFDQGAVARPRGWQVAAGVGGGLLVVASFMADAGTVLAGGVPRDFPWPIFLAGMLLAGTGAVATLRGRPAMQR